MARNGSGVFTLPVADYTAGTTIVAADMNSNLGDIETALTQSLAYDGQTTPVANLPMGGFKHTGVADGTSRTHYQSVAQGQDGSTTYAAATDGGTDAYTASLSPAITAYVTGMRVRLKFNEANTTATPTIALNGIASPKTIVRNDGSALNIGDIAANGIYDLTYSGTNFQLASSSVSTDPTKLPLAGGTMAGDVTHDTGSQIFLDDSVTTPGSTIPLSFDGDTDTGLLRTGANALALVAGGATIAAVTATGVVVTGTFSATNILSGTYTPTLTAVANLDGATPQVTQYIRVGSVVHVGGRVDLDPTAGTATTQVRISLPVASNFTQPFQCGGTASAELLVEPGGISADTTNDAAQLSFISATTANHSLYFTFTYLIL